MSSRCGIDAPGSIDLVRVPESGPVELVIADSGSWDGSDHRQILLQEKLNRYLEFVLDGELATAQPESAGRPWTIVIESSSTPDPRTIAYLRRADNELRRSGGGCVLRLVQPPAH